MIRACCSHLHLMDGTGAIYRAGAACNPIDGSLRRNRVVAMLYLPRM